jgi:hypothetical protein
MRPLQRERGELGTREATKKSGREREARVASSTALGADTIAAILI